VFPSSVSALQNCSFEMFAALRWLLNSFKQPQPTKGRNSVGVVLSWYFVVEFNNQILDRMMSDENDCLPVTLRTMSI
jgi:hypothetical protein